MKYFFLLDWQRFLFFYFNRFLFIYMIERAQGKGAAEGGEKQSLC